MPDLHRETQNLGIKPALILVDMIRAFTNPDCPLGCSCDDVVAVNARLLSEFRERSLPIVFTTVVYSDASQAVIFRNRLPALNLLETGSPLVEIDSRLSRQENELLIEKHYASSFFGTDLIQRLNEREADSLVVTGLTTSGCVRATAVDGLQSDFPVVVVSDAVGDRNEEAHTANLHDLNAKYAEVMTADQVLSHLP